MSRWKPFLRKEKESDIRPKLMVLCGLPGSGKSTFGKQMAAETGAIRYASDELRQELYGSEEDQAHNEKIFREMTRRTKAALQAGQSVIYDATNITSGIRRSLLQDLGSLSCEKICFVMAVPVPVCVRNNEKRERQVPEEAIFRMYLQWETPGLFEGWDRVEVRYPFPEYRGALGTPEACRKRLDDFDQENIHHRLTLGQHLYCTWEHVCRLDRDETEENREILRAAALVHDIGKVGTKNFSDSRGDQSEFAHYYGHENIGAYEALFLDVPQLLEVSLLINLHMQPNSWERNEDESWKRTVRRYQKRWGEDLYRQVMILHRADRAAH